jgi:hypothetical protein
MAVEQLNPADDASWQARRGSDVTASVAGAMLGVHPYMTPYQLWALKTGRMSELRENRARQRGLLFEPIAVELVRHERQDWQIEYPLGRAYWRDAEARIGATPDAFATRPDWTGRGVLQIKTVSEDAWRQGWIDPDTHDIVLPAWIAVQAIVEADLTDSAFGTVAAIRTPRGLDDLIEGLVHSGCGNIEEILAGVAYAWLALGKLEVAFVEVPIHAGIMRKVRAAVAEFWRVIEAGEEPPPDWSRDGDTVLDVFRDSEDAVASLADPQAFNNLVEHYDQVSHTRLEADKELAYLKPQIIDMLGNAERAETERWKISAKTQHRKAYSVRESWSRPLRIKDKTDTRKETAA